MSAEKKTELKRIVIFCTFAYLLLIIPALIGRQILGGPMFSEENAATSITAAVAALGMLSPTAANFITRLITKEGMSESYLSLSMRDGKYKYYLIAFFVPIVFFGFLGAISAFAFLSDMPLGEAVDFSQPGNALRIALMSAGMSPVGLAMYFGEEFGWRAYLTPKLTKLMPEPAAVTVSGIIWGLWHAPLTVQGHNSGMDYPGFPFVGILLMCLMCMSFSSFLTILTKRTKSVFPAAICHMVINNASAGMFFGLLQNQSADFSENIEIIPYTIAIMLPVYLLGIISFAIICIEYRKGKQTNYDK